MKLKEILYLVLYSFEDLVNDLFEFITLFKKAKTWSFILYASIFLMVYYRKLTLVNSLLIFSLILVIYIIRQHKEPEYHKSLRRKAFLNNDEEKIKEYYDKYKRQCYFSRKEPLNYKDYKRAEIRKLDGMYKELNDVQ